MLKPILLALVLLVLLAGVFVFWSYARFSGAIDEDIRRLVAAAAPSGVVVTEVMLAPLPEPARRYLTHAGVVGQPIPSVVRVTQSGRIRSSAEAAWMELEAEETYSIDPPAFVWRAWFPKKSMPFVLGRDAYLRGEASILMRMLAVWPVAAESGPALAEAGLMRYLNEMMWFPAAFLGANVTLAPADADSFRATITDRGMTATATLTVDADGRLVNFVAQRFNTATGTMETWETPLQEYGECAGLQLPVAGKAVWKLAEGDFEYIELAIDGVVYETR